MADYVPERQLRLFSGRGSPPLRPLVSKGLTSMTKYIAKFQAALTTRERGATAVEYGLMVALIAIVIIVAVALLGKNLSTLFNNTATSV